MAKPLERMWARVCREAGGRVRTHAFQRNLNLRKAKVRDDRQIEVVVSGLPTFKGSQVAVDATLVSPLHRDGTARNRAHWEDGAALQDAQKKKTGDYPEFVGEDR